MLIMRLMLKRLRSLKHLSAMNFIVSGHGLETTYKPAINQMAPQGMFAETDIGRIFR